jgi:hypothetical protein
MSPKSIRDANHRGTVQISATTRSGIVSAAVAIAAACSSPPAAAPGSGASPDVSTQTRNGSVGDTLHVPLGRSASVDGGRLVVTFVSRGPDSRCPANVVCVWMGDAAVRIGARIGNTSVERDLHTGVEPHGLSIDGYLVTVVGMLPYPGTEAAEAPNAAPTVLVQVTRR